MKILMHRYLHSFSSFGRNIISRGDGGLNFVKLKIEILSFFFCMLTFSITNVCNLECLTDRDMQESRKNQDSRFKILFENPVVNKAHEDTTYIQNIYT